MKIFDWQSSDQETMSPQKDYLLLMFSRRFGEPMMINSR
jgi:hypothetical protein